MTLLHREQRLVTTEVRHEARPPQRDAEPAIDQPLLEDEEHDEDEEDEACEDEHAVEPVGLLERGDEVLRGRHEGGEHVVCCGCGLEGGGGGFCCVRGAVREGRPVKGMCVYLVAVSRGRNALARPA